MFAHAHAWFADCVTVGDQEYIYYGGFSEGHEIGTRQIRLSTLRKDDFVSRDTGATAGHLRTPLVPLNGSSIAMNAEVEGELRVRILDADNKPLPRFDWEDYQPIRGDSVRHPL